MLTAGPGGEDTCKQTPSPGTARAPGSARAGEGAVTAAQGVRPPAGEGISVQAAGTASAMAQRPGGGGHNVMEEPRNISKHGLFLEVCFELPLSWAAQRKANPEGVGTCKSTCLSPPNLNRLQLQPVPILPQGLCTCCPDCPQALTSLAPWCPPCLSLTPLPQPPSPNGSWHGVVTHHHLLASFMALDMLVAGHL